MRVCVELTTVCASAVRLSLSESVSVHNKLVCVWQGRGSLYASRSVCDPGGLSVIRVCVAESVNGCH